MTGTKTKAVNKMLILTTLFVLVGLVLSVISSNMAYPLTKLTLLVAGSAVAIVLYALAAWAGLKMPRMLRDAILLIALLGAALAMCTLIEGRATLVGYIYFSDLESNNPVAVQAMNLAIGGVAAYFVAILLTVIEGFKKG